MAKPLFGNLISTLGRLNLGFDTDNLALITVVDKEFPVVVQQYAVSRSERTQIVPCFNDFTHIYVFGSNPIQITLNGFTLLTDSTVNLDNLIREYEQNYRAFHTNLAKVIMRHGETLRGFITDFTYSATAETPVLVNFNLNMIGLQEGDSVLSSNQSSASGTTESGRERKAVSVGQ